MIRQNRLNHDVANCEYMLIGNEKELSKIYDIGNLEIDKNEIKNVSKRKYGRSNNRRESILEPTIQIS